MEAASKGETRGIFSSQGAGGTADWGGEECG